MGQWPKSTDEGLRLIFGARIVTLPADACTDSELPVADDSIAEQSGKV